MCCVQATAAVGVGPASRCNSSVAWTRGWGRRARSAGGFRSPLVGNAHALVVGKAHAHASLSVPTSLFLQCGPRFMAAAFALGLVSVFIHFVYGGDWGLPRPASEWDASSGARAPRLRGSVTETCLLRDSFACPFRCPRRMPFSCLTARVAWHTPLPRISCCFECCLTYWVRKLALNTTFQHYLTAIPWTYTPRKRTPIHPCANALNFPSVMMNDITCLADIIEQHALPQHHLFLATTVPDLCYLDQLEHPINLINCKNDGVFPAEDAKLMKILEHPKVNRVFAQSPRIFTRDYCIGRHPKLTTFPRVVNAIKAEAFLRNHSAPLDQREHTIFCGALSWYPVRAQPLSTLKRKQFPCVKGKLNADEYFQRMVTSKFVVSLRGGGETNFRDLEALYSGAIPIVQDGAVTKQQYGDLPVLRVKHWETLNLTHLEGLWDDYVRRGKRLEFTVEKVYFPYWLHQLAEHVVDADGNFVRPPTPVPRDSGRCRRSSGHYVLEWGEPSFCEDLPHGADLIGWHLGKPTYSPGRPPPRM